MPLSATRTIRSPPCSTDFSSGALTSNLALDGWPSIRHRYCLVTLLVADRRLQAGQARPASWQDQHAAGVAIQPMHQLQVLVRPRRAHQLDRAVADAAAAVAGHAGGLVDDQKVLVLENDRIG